MKRKFIETGDVFLALAITLMIALVGYGVATGVAAQEEPINGGRLRDVGQEKRDTQGTELKFWEFDGENAPYAKDITLIIPNDWPESLVVGGCWKIVGTYFDLQGKATRLLPEAVECPPTGTDVQVFGRSFSERVDKDLLMENYKRKLEEVAGRPHVHEWAESGFSVIEHPFWLGLSPRARRILEICKADGMLRVPSEK